MRRAAFARLALAPVLAIVVLAAGTARRTLATARGIVLGALAGNHRRQIAVMPFDLGADQTLDRVDIFAVGFGRDGERLARTAGAAGAADAVDIVLGMD